MDSNLCFSFGSCDILFPYQLGIAKKLFDTLNYKLDYYTFAGSSHGIIAATLLSLKIDPELFANYYFSQYYSKSPISALNNILDNINNEELIIKKMHKRCSISVTKLPFYEKVNINEFTNLQDLKKWLEATCNLRILNKLLPTTINSYLYVDGGLSCRQPIYNNYNNITISVFYRSPYLISPSIPIYKYSLSNTIDEKDYYHLYDLGIDDCQLWLTNQCYI